jgi:phosphotransferase system IIA component
VESGGYYSGTGGIIWDRSITLVAHSLYPLPLQTIYHKLFMNRFRVEYFSGTVVGSQKHTQTHVYSEGGGGLIGPIGGSIKAPQVKSYNTTRHDIFLRLQNGQEMNVFFPLDTISVREGHRITLLAVFRHGVELGCYARLFNHNTRLINNVLTNDAWLRLVNSKVTYPPANPTQQRESQQIMLTKPEGKSGFFKRVAGAVQNQMKGLKAGWDIGASLDHSVLAVEFEEVVQEALVTVGEWEV